MLTCKCLKFDLVITCFVTMEICEFCLSWKGDFVYIPGGFLLLCLMMRGCIEETLRSLEGNAQIFIKVPK